MSWEMAWLNYKEKEIDKILEDIQNIEGIESFEYEIINPHYRQFN